MWQWTYRIPFVSLYPGTSRVWSQFSTWHRSWGVWRHSPAHCVWRERKSQNTVPAVVFFFFSFISTGQTKLLWELIFPICCCYFLLEMTVQVMCKCLNTKSWCLTKCHFSICCISKGSAQFKGGHSSSGVLNIVSQSPYLAECGPHARECPAHFIEDDLASKKINIFSGEE